MAFLLPSNVFLNHSNFCHVGAQLPCPSPIIRTRRDRHKSHCEGSLNRGTRQSRPNSSPQALVQSSPTTTHNEHTPVVQELSWPWKWGSHIRYFKAGTSGPPLLLVHGFGVGAWHFEHNVERLAALGYTVYAIDLLGQGSSWPSLVHPSDPAWRDEDGPLRLSITTWTDQLAGFLRDVVGQPAYMAGNSLGGYVAVSLAASHPELVKGLVLLNSTPFWSFRPSGDQPQGLWSLLGFDGSVPAPQNIRSTVERFWWNNLRSRETIESMLSMVYAHKPTIHMDSSVAERIIEATEHPSALDAFVSIVASPKSPRSFDVLLCATQCPICLVYGKQDPWVVPAWGQRAQQVLTQHGCPPAMYLELDGAGHCPHHEAPVTTNTAMQLCLEYMNQLVCQPGSMQGAERPPPPVPVGHKVPVAEVDGRVVVIEHVDGQPRTLGERFMHTLWRYFDPARAPPVSSHKEAVGEQKGHA